MAFLRPKCLLASFCLLPFMQNDLTLATDFVKALNGALCSKQSVSMALDFNLVSILAIFLVMCDPSMNELRAT